MNDQQLLEVLATTDRYPATRPLPDGWVDDSHDALPEAQGSQRMSTTQKIRSVESEATPPAPRRWKGAIAAIAVLVAAIATMVIINGDDAEVATTTTAPDLGTGAGRLAAAEAIVTGYYSFDEAALTEAIGTDLDIPIFLDQARAGALNSQILDRRPCHAPTPSQVVCETATTNDFTDAFGVEDVERLSIIFSDGAVIALTVGYNVPRYINDFWPWLREAHHNDIDTACAGYESGIDVEECMTAYVAFIPEFIASDAYTGPPVP